MREIVAHKLRFCAIGSRYGPILKTAPMMARPETMVTMILTQLIGREMGGCGRPSSCRESQAWTASAFWLPLAKS